MGKGTQTVTQKNTPHPEAMAAYRDVMGRAKYVADKPYIPYTGQTVAGMNPTQTAAIAGLGGPSADLETARGLAGQGSAALDLSPEAMQRYMNPYLDSVINATMANMQREDAIAQQGVVGNAISSNAFGGDRAGIAGAELARTQKMARDSTIAQLRAQGFNEATALAMADRDAATRGAQMYQGLAGANIDALKASLNAGTLLQTQGQNELNDLYKRFLESRDYGKDTTQWLGSLAGGMGSLMGGTSSQTQPGPSAFSQILGAATSIIPFLAKGGRVGYDLGGGVGLGDWLKRVFGGGAGRPMDIRPPSMRRGLNAGMSMRDKFRAQPERMDAVRAGLDMMTGEDDQDQFSWLMPTMGVGRPGFDEGGGVSKFASWISNRFRRPQTEGGGDLLGLPMNNPLGQLMGLAGGQQTGSAGGAGLAGGAQGAGGSGALGWLQGGDFFSGGPMSVMALPAAIFSHLFKTDDNPLTQAWSSSMLGGNLPWSAPASSGLTGAAAAKAYGYAPGGAIDSGILRLPITGAGQMFPRLARPEVSAGLAGGMGGFEAEDPENGIASFFGPVLGPLFAKLSGGDPASLGMLPQVFGLKATGASANPNELTGEAAARAYGYAPGGAVDTRSLPYLTEDDLLGLPEIAGDLEDDPADLVPLMPSPGGLGAPGGGMAPMPSPATAEAPPAPVPGLGGGATPAAPPRRRSAAGAPSAGMGAYAAPEGVAPRVEEAMRYFMSQGWTREQSAGLVGRLMQESGPSLDPSALGDGGRSFGVAQWHDPREGQGRWTALKNWAAEQGLDPQDFQTQLAFANWELNNTESRAGEMLRAAQTPQEAAAAAMAYERPQGYSPRNPAAGHGWNNTLNNALALAGGVGGGRRGHGIPDVGAPIVVADPLGGGPAPGAPRRGLAGPSQAARRGEGRDHGTPGRRSLSDKFREDAWRLPLLMAGLQMLAGQSANAGTNIGQGAASGLNAWMQMQEAAQGREGDEFENALRQRELDLRSRGLDLEAQKLEAELAGGSWEAPNIETVRDPEGNEISGFFVEPGTDPREVSWLPGFVQVGGAEPAPAPEAPETRTVWDEGSGRQVKEEWRGADGWVRVGGVEAAPSAGNVQTQTMVDDTGRKYVAERTPDGRWVEVGTAELAPTAEPPESRTVMRPDGTRVVQNFEGGAWVDDPDVAPDPLDKPPQVEGYEYYVAQETEAGRPAKSYEDWVVATLRAGATPAQENAIDRGLGERFLSWFDEAGKATSTLGTLELMEEFTEDPSFYTGWGASQLATAKRFGEALGFDTGVENTDNFRSMANKLVIDTMGSLGAAISNSDRQFYEQMFPNLENTVEGNRMLIEIGKRVQERTILKSQMAQEYIDEHGKMDAGFMREWTAFNEANPMFADLMDDDAAPTQPVGTPENPAPRPTPGQVVQTLPDGRQIIYLGGDPNEETSYEMRPAGGR